MEQNHNANGRSLDPQSRDQLWNKYFAQNGFGNDAMGTASDPLAFCGECGKNKLKLLKEYAVAVEALYIAQRNVNTNTGSHTRKIVHLFLHKSTDHYAN